MRVLALGSLCAAILLCMPGRATATEPPVDEALARARNLARAHYQNEHYANSAAAYRDCIRLAPDSAIDHLNLSVAETQAHEDQLAREHLLRAKELGCPFPHVEYLLGMVSLRLALAKESVAAYAALLAIDPICVPALYGQGLALARLDQLDEAIASWKRAIEIEPDHGPSYYQLFRAYTKQDRRELAQPAFDEFVRIKEAGLGPGTSRSKVDRSRYLELVGDDIGEAQPQDSDENIELTLRLDTDASAQLSGGRASGSALALGDIDGDGRPEILSGQLLAGWAHGRFVAIPTEAVRGLGPIRTAEFGDIDNDGALDLVIGGNALVLLRGTGDGEFTPLSPDSAFVDGDAPPPAHIRSLRLVDLDHEGDLDILLIDRDGRFSVWRNNGNSSFSSISSETEIRSDGSSLAKFVCSDVEIDNDIDVLLFSREGRHGLWANLRDGRFDDRVDASGLADVGPIADAAVGDLNNDGTPDLVLFAGNGAAPQVWLNGGRARFHADPTPLALEQATHGLSPRTGALVDLDNDGDLDLLVAGDAARLLRNDGSGRFGPWPQAALETLEEAIVAIQSADLDGDGDVDLVLRMSGGSVQLLRNDGGNQNHRIRIRLFGTKNSLDGYGAKVWTRAGNFFQVRESFDRWIDLGVGRRERLDVVGLRWPTGVNQNLLDQAVDPHSVIEVTERPGLSESCPFVYAFNGERFVFVGDVLDNTPVGISLAPGVHFQANHREGLRISGEQLVEHDHRLSIRFTQELEEISYVDRLRLIAVDHSEESELVSNDRFSGAPFAPAGIHVVERSFPALSAVDARGEDISAALLNADRNYADDCPPIRRQYPGITKWHAMILDPGPGEHDAPLSLFLRGSTLWPEASVNMAVAQNPDIRVQGAALDVVEHDGSWLRICDDLGLPAGMDKILPVNLNGVFPTQDRRVRVSTSFAVVWDQAFFANQSIAEIVPTPRIQTELRPLAATLRERGFSKLLDLDGKLPELYDYHELMEESPFTDIHVGPFTRFGDVIELVDRIDDRFVVMAPGDELALEFAAITLPPLREGWRRDYVLEVEGWIKDGDLRTASCERVEPLPYHGMSAYPPPAGEGHSGDERHQLYLREYQTRILPTRPVSPRYP